MSFCLSICLAVSPSNSLPPCPGSYSHTRLYLFCCFFSDSLFFLFYLFFSVMLFLSFSFCSSSTFFFHCFSFYFFLSCSASFFFRLLCLRFFCPSFSFLPMSIVTAILFHSSVFFLPTFFSLSRISLFSVFFI